MAEAVGIGQGIVKIPDKRPDGREIISKDEDVDIPPGFHEIGKCLGGRDGRQIVIPVAVIRAEIGSDGVDGIEYGDLSTHGEERGAELMEIPAAVGANQHPWCGTWIEEPVAA